MRFDPPFWSHWQAMCNKWKLCHTLNSSEIYSNVSDVNNGDQLTSQRSCLVATKLPAQYHRNVSQITELHKLQEIERIMTCQAKQHMTTNYDMHLLEQCTSCTQAIHTIPRTSSDSSPTHEMRLTSTPSSRTPHATMQSHIFPHDSHYISAWRVIWCKNT